MNFQKDIQEYIQGWYDGWGIKYVPTSDLDKDLLKLFTLQKKYILSHPRKVELSKELIDKLNANHKHKYEILWLKKAFEEGDDINAHQSRNLFTYQAHDKLVYCWSIYHFHLSLECGKDYFNARTKEVLFAFVDRERVLFLDVMQHKNPPLMFADKVLLEILDNHWPHELHVIEGVIGLSHNLSTEERHNLRKHNITEGSIEINGKFVFPPSLGQATSGDSSDASMKVMEFKRWINYNEKVLSLDCAEKIIIDTHKLNSAPKYKIDFTDEGPQIIDDVSKTIIVKYRHRLQINCESSS